MHSAYIEAGFDPARFWEISPRETTREIQAATVRLNREHKNRAWLAWHIAALGRIEKMPSLQKLMGEPEPEQTEDEMIAIATSWAIAAERRQQ